MVCIVYSVRFDAVEIHTWAAFHLPRFLASLFSVRSIILRIGLIALLFVKSGKYNSKKRGKGPVKLIKLVKIAHSFLQSVSNQFYVIILSLPV